MLEMKTAKQTLKEKTKNYFDYLDQVLLRVGDKAFFKEVLNNIERCYPISIYDYAIDRCNKGMSHGEAALWIWEQVVEMCKMEFPKPYHPFVRDPYIGLGERVRRRNTFEASCMRCF
jgi:hypothetical protein